MISPFFISPFNNRGKFGGGAAIPFPSGAVAYYKLDEASGAVIDSVAANNGTNVGAVPNVAGKINTGYSFVANDYINIDPVLSAVSSATQGTISVWVKPTSITIPSNQRIIGFGAIATNNLISITRFTNGKIVTGAVLNGVVQWILESDNPVFSTSEYSLLTVVHNGLTCEIKVNNVSIAQTITTSFDESVWFNSIPLIDNARIGCINFNLTNNFQFYDGSLDEIGIWNRALSATEVSNLYNGGAGLPFST